MIEPAPKVEPATALPARPKSAPRGIEPAVPSDKVTKTDVDAAPTVEPAHADPPSERGSIDSAPIDGRDDATSKAMSEPDKLRSSHHCGISFESHAAVVIGPAEKSILQRCLFPRRLRNFDDPSVLSYGECKRYVVVTRDGNVHVYADASDRASLYVIPLAGLVPRREDPDRPHYFSHSISPTIQGGGCGIVAKTKSRRSLDTVLLVEGGVSSGTTVEEDDGDCIIRYQFSFDRDEAGINASGRFVDAVLSSSKGNAR